MQEIIDIRQEIFNKSSEIGKTIYIEEYIEGEEYNLNSLYDGNNLITFPPQNIDLNIIADYNKKLERMLKSEKVDFVGFINSKVIIAEDKVYNIGFRFEFAKPNTDVDFLYLLNLAIYQKLDEITL